MKRQHAQDFTRGLLILVTLLGVSGCFQHTAGNHEIKLAPIEPVQIPEIDGLILNQLGCHPSELEAGSTTDVIFSCIVSSESGWLPEHLILSQVDERGVEIRQVGKMMDDGKDPDIAAGDAVYTATASIVGENGSFRFRASAWREGEMTHSPIYHMRLTPPSPDTGPTAGEQIVTDPNTGAKMLANQLLLSLKAETSRARQSQIMQSVEGKIIATIPGGVLQLGIPGEATSTTVLRAVRQLQKYPETIYAEPNFVDEVDELPGD
ncbi:MAG: hypothetical protein CMJ95_03265 [Planctomycetes bacterium]|nr:hypothetical protein [Planctomycetota bacterium]